MEEKKTFENKPIEEWTTEDCRAFKREEMRYEAKHDY